jgi:hypothetical protein
MKGKPSTLIKKTDIRARVGEGPKSALLTGQPVAMRRRHAAATTLLALVAKAEKSLGQWL